MKFLSLLACLFLTTAYAQKIKVLHYNIKELDSKKIKTNDSQIGFVKKVLKKYQFDVISLNEIQYDYKNIPNTEYMTTGKNVSKLLRLLERSHLKFQSFHPANTGKNAKTKPDGTYYNSPNSNDARSHADQINFGVMPGQYSSAGASIHKIKNELIITDLKWKDFNPKLNLSKFKTAAGKSFPKDMKLFDKNFSDITLEIDGKEVHVILLHTVPSYHFGNKHSINMFRNAQQLKFLEWYLTGKTDFNVGKMKIKPLKKESYFIAMGDFNVAYNAKGTQKDGADTLKRIFKKANTWIKPNLMTYTNESSGYKLNPARLLLDYIVSSKNIKSSKARIILPKMKRYELGCEGSNIKTQRQLNIKSKFYKVEYKKGKKTCYALINPEYYYFKQASDHFPLYGEFELL